MSRSLSNTIKRKEVFPVLTVEQIQKFIENNKASSKKQDARTGLQYYEGEHNLKNHRIFFFDTDSNWREVAKKHWRIEDGFNHLCYK